MSVRMNWQVTPATADSTAPNATLAQWVGLGSGTLLQNGVIGDANANPRFFYEIVGGTGDTGREIDANIGVSNNDYVQVQTSYDNAGRAAFYFVNLTAQTAWSPRLIVSSKPSSSQAEWITERVAVDGKYTKLAKFPTRAFHKQVAEDGYNNLYQAVGAISGHYPVDMTSCDRTQVLATAGTIGADDKSSDNVWHAYGPLPLDSVGCT
ncbi:MAG: hypothetical protein J2P17_01940 [Mycobacterium sp.]|nr:hypothetical protein [Mycobacterium sp.]